MYSELPDLLIQLSVIHLGVYLHITVVFQLPFVSHLAANPCFSPMSPFCSIDSMYRSMFVCVDSILYLTNIVCHFCQLTYPIK